MAKKKSTLAKVGNAVADAATAVGKTLGLVGNGKPKKKSAAKKPAAKKATTAKKPAPKTAAKKSAAKKK